MRNLFLFLFPVLLCACGPTTTKIICQHIPETPSKLAGKTVKSIGNPNAAVTFLLHSQEEIYYDFTHIKIFKPESSEFTWIKMDSITGDNETLLIPGYYSITIDALESPDLTLDSVLIEPRNHYLFEIQLGNPDMYQSVVVKEKQKRKRN